jgi:hypothetical protein
MMKDKDGKKRIKIVLKDGHKFFCEPDVNAKGDLYSQGCRIDTDEPDVRV